MDRRKISPEQRRDIINERRKARLIQRGEDPSRNSSIKQPHETWEEYDARTARWISDPFRDPSSETPEQKEWKDRKFEAERLFRETGDPSGMIEVGLFPTEEEEALLSMSESIGINIEQQPHIGPNYIELSFYLPNQGYPALRHSYVLSPKLAQSLLEQLSDTLSRDTSRLRKNGYQSGVVNTTAAYSRPWGDFSDSGSLISSPQSPDRGLSDAPRPRNTS